MTATPSEAKGNPMTTPADLQLTAGQAALMDAVRRLQATIETVVPSSVAHWAVEDARRALRALARTVDQVRATEPGPNPDVEQFRDALVAALCGSESQVMGLGPGSGDWLGVMADFVADFDPSA
jgi:hypothetical protein